MQPQWVYDSINSRSLLPVSVYMPGQTLPPHLSPFTDEKPGDYVPPERVAQLKLAGYGLLLLLFYIILLTFFINKIFSYSCDFGVKLLFKRTMLAVADIAFDFACIIGQKHIVRRLGF